MQWTTELLEAAMEQDDKTGKVTATPEEVALYNMFLTEAIFELLAEKGILTGEQVKERIKKLKSETTLRFRWVQ
jgi:glutamate synthase domain-containing protein 2